jgi:hypothetical protein
MKIKKKSVIHYTDFWGKLQTKKVTEKVTENIKLFYVICQSILDKYIINKKKNKK